jgi:hypothetical protein
MTTKEPETANRRTFEPQNVEVKSNQIVPLAA